MTLWLFYRIMVWSLQLVIGYSDPNLNPDLNPIISPNPSFLDGVNAAAMAGLLFCNVADDFTKWLRNMMDFCQPASGAASQR